MLENPKSKKQKLNSTDDRYKTLFEQVNASVFLTDLDGKILEANMKSCDLLGYNWDELNDLTLKDIFPASIKWNSIIDEIASKGGMDFEAENIRKDGSHFPVSVSTSLFTYDGKPVMLALIWDITERKRAERKLKESEEKYRGLFECTTDGIIVLDARGEILDVNCRALELFRYKKEEMVNKNFLGMGLLTGQSLSIVVKQFEELLSDKNAKTHETSIINKNGDRLDIELSSFFLYQKDNEIDNFVVIIRDISDRKKAEIKLSREHSLLQTLMDNIPDSVYFKDENHRFIMVNKSKASHSNVKPEDMIGKTDFDFLNEDEARKSFKDDEEIIRTGKYIINKVEKITRSDGGQKWLSVTKVPRFDQDGNIIGTAGISRDITEWKKIEEEKSKEKKKKK